MPFLGGLPFRRTDGFLIVSAWKGATLTAFRIGEDGSLTRAASIACDERISDLVTR